jgi:hypothetical protein
MSDPQSKDPQSPFEIPFQNQERDRRTQPRSETTLSRIEDATYAVLRRHEKQSA